MSEATSLGTSKDWTQFKFVLPLNIRQYVRERSEAYQTNDCFQHIQGLQPTILEYWDKSSEFEIQESVKDHWKEAHCNNLLVSVSWLNDFITDHKDLAVALHALSTSANSCTRLVLSLDTLLLNAIIMSDWKLRACEAFKAWDITFHSIRFDDRSADGMSFFIRRQIERKNGVIGALWKSLQASVARSSKHRNYQAFSSKVAEFCLKAGCPAVGNDPVRDISSLRQYLLSHDSGTREAELRKEIEKLKIANRAQQRIITNLVFRHLLEALPAQSTRTMSATAKWNSFFRTALTEARNRHEQGITSHPLLPVLKKYHRFKQIENVGANLYSTLSTNIHHFSGQFTVFNDQWNALEADILMALTPLPQNETETGIDWDLERLRY